jgi:hypothetical protein
MSAHAGRAHHRQRGGCGGCGVQREIRHGGESVKVVQSRLGHANAAETLDTYSYLRPDSDDRTLAAVDSVLSRSAVHATLPSPLWYCQVRSGVRYDAAPHR